MTKQEYDAAIKIRRAYQAYTLRATIAARIMNRIQIKYGKERLKSSILKSLHIADNALKDVETGSFKEVVVQDECVLAGSDDRRIGRALGSVASLDPGEQCIQLPLSQARPAGAHRLAHGECSRAPRTS